MRADSKYVELSATFWCLESNQNLSRHHLLPTTGYVEGDASKLDRALLHIEHDGGGAARATGAMLPKTVFTFLKRVVRSFSPHDTSGQAMRHLLVSEWPGWRSFHTQARRPVTIQIHSNTTISQAMLAPNTACQASAISECVCCVVLCGVCVWCVWLWSLWLLWLLLSCCVFVYTVRSRSQRIWCGTQSMPQVLTGGGEREGEGEEADGTINMKVGEKPPTAFPLARVLLVLFCELMGALYDLPWTFCRESYHDYKVVTLEN